MINRKDSTALAECANLLLTPKHVGEAMSAGDPYYRPNFKAQNPFATLKRFKVDIIIARREGGGGMRDWVKIGSALANPFLDQIKESLDPSFKNKN